MIAHHHTTALALLEAAGTERPAELVDDARVALRRAGDRAAALNSFVAAADYYRKAFDLWPLDDPDRAVLQFGLARAQFQSKAGDERDVVSAADALLQQGDQLLAAEAFALAAEGAWDRADRATLDAHLSRAMALVEPLPRSRSKAWIVSQAARYAMLADRNDEAIQLADEALEVAAELDLPEVRVHALMGFAVVAPLPAGPVGRRPRPGRAAAGRTHRSLVRGVVGAGGTRVDSSKSRRRGRRARGHEGIARDGARSERSPSAPPSACCARCRGPVRWVDGLSQILGTESIRMLFAPAPVTGKTTLWTEAAIALVTDDFVRAIELYERAGDVTDVAIVRLRAAQRLVEEGRRPEADAHLRPALAFFRFVGATRYVREGEALLAAAS